MKELVVISGKGGTGKTSIVACFAVLAETAVLADCDVDAADLHLVLEPSIVRREKFSGGKRAGINPGYCTACGKCEEVCRFDAVSFDGPGNGRVDRTFRVDPVACEGCGVCAWFCPEAAVEFAPVINGEHFVSETRCGPMVHARLGIAEENSGKLVSIIRAEARRVAEQQKRDLVIIDGPPGIGCPVIASIAETTQALIVAEPTLSAKHDMERLADLIRHFDIPAMVCINKWDLNPGIAGEIESLAAMRGIQFVGRIRYDPAVTRAQVSRRSVVEYQTGGSAGDICQVWTSMSEALGEGPVGVELSRDG